MMGKKPSEFIDISLSMEPALPIWPGSVGMKIERLSCFENGNNVNVSMLTCDVHTGTHVETSLHFFPGGDSVTQVPLDTLIGDAYVAHIPAVGVITPDDLAEVNIPAGTERLLLRTENSNLWRTVNGIFQPDFVAPNSDAAQWMVDRGIKLLGVDYLSVELLREDASRNHIVLLSGGVIILEGLNLSRVDQGFYELICLPLKLTGAEGAPARAVLKKKNYSENGNEE
jgi:arylformamidase